MEIELIEAKLYNSRDDNEVGELALDLLELRDWVVDEIADITRLESTVYALRQSLENEKKRIDTNLSYIEDSLR